MYFSAGKSVFSNGVSPFNLAFQLAGYIPQGMYLGRFTWMEPGKVGKDEGSLLTLSETTNLLDPLIPHLYCKIGIK